MVAFLLIDESIAGPTAACVPDEFILYIQ